MKAYAASKNLSVSELVESYFRTVTRTSPGKRIVDLMDELDKPDLDGKADLKELFYKENGI
jgi:hypothetical protein